MDAPKCKTCGERHYGPCLNPPVRKGAAKSISPAPTTPVGGSGKTNGTKSVSLDTPAQAPESAPEQQVVAALPNSGFDPLVVAKAVPFYLKHLERSKTGMVAYRKRQKKKKRKAKNKA